MKRVFFLVLIIVMFLFSLASVNALFVSTVVINETCDSPVNWSIGSSATVNNGGNSLCEASSATSNFLLYVHKLINLSTNTNNFTIEIYDLALSTPPHAFTINIQSNSTGLSSSRTEIRGLLNSEDNGGGGGVGQKLTLAGTDAFFVTSDEGVPHLFRLVFFLNNSISIFVDEIQQGNAQFTAGQANSTAFLLLADSGSSTSMDGFALYNGTTTEIFVADITPPIIVSTQINDTTPNFFEIISFTVSATDDGELNRIEIADNRTGAFSNFTFVTVSGTSITSIFNITAQVGTIQLQATVTDTSGNSAQSNLITVTSTDIPLFNTTGLYRFEEGSGTTAIDLSNNSNTGIHTADYIGSKGGNGTGNFALNFSLNKADGVNLSNEAQFDFDFNNDLSVTAWINVSSIQNPPLGVVGKLDTATEKGWVVRVLGSTGAISVVLQSQLTPFRGFEVTSTNLISTNTWTHIAFTYDATPQDATGISIFINGIQETEIIVSDTIFVDMLNNIQVQIGEDGSSTSEFNGGLDEVAIFSNTLTAQEILDIFNNGLSEIINTTEVNNIYTSSGDTQAPTIILIDPSLNVNNTRNNTIPLDITFQVTDDSFNSIICNLDNSTILDTGTFIQGVPSNLTLAEGEITLDQTFSNLAIVCFDNTVLNNSASLLLNITLDSINPIIFPIAPPDKQKFNKDIVSSIQIKANCTDIPVFKLNITITNASDTIASFETLTVVNNFLVIDEQLSISALGSGNYTVTYVCSDPHTKNKIPDYIINKNSSDNKIKWTTPSGNEFELKYSVPMKNPIQTLNWGSSKSDDDSRYNFWYKLNVTEDGTERDLNFELENKKFPITYLPNSQFKGHFIMDNNFIDFEFGDADATYEITKNDNNNYEIVITTTKTFLNFTSVGELNTEVVTTTFEVFFINQIVDFFIVTECKNDTGSAILLGLFLIISLFLITLGITSQVGFIGFFGSLALLFTSLRIIPCLSALASILIFLSVVLMFFFIFRGFFSRSFSGLTGTGN